uniref:Retrotransposon gag domain-containing protein n=1 Tax=Ananas comosus var. bracteatus TaxID=296719 RepID=A0A6V7NHQ9_ANACO|nr:unnamed protein product [Ananas comosus var. bracteatus]
MELVAMHLDDKADTWFQGYLAEKRMVHWADFSEEICRRFDTRGSVDVVEEFNKLVQTGTVEEYQEQFEDLKARLLTTDSQFSVDYFLSSFLSGLKDEIRSAVKMLYPRTLTQAFKQAKLQEQTIAAMMKKSKQMLRLQGITNSPSNYKGMGSATSGRWERTDDNLHNNPLQHSRKGEHLDSRQSNHSLNNNNNKDVHRRRLGQKMYRDGQQTEEPNQRYLKLIKRSSEWLTNIKTIFDP